MRESIEGAAWAVVYHGPDWSRISSNCIRRTRSEAIAAFTGDSSWKQWRAYGYRVERVRVLTVSA